jgi:PAS domain S-box-containing protein
MNSVPGESERSSRQHLIDRLRFILLICAVVVSGFALRELIYNWRGLGGQFSLRIFGLVLAVTGIVFLKRPWAVRVAWPLAIGIVSLAYVMTAVAGMVSPTREYLTTAVLFVGAALATATIMPWGFLAQSVTVLIGGISLLVAVLIRDGNLDALTTDPGAAVVMALILSAATAFEFHRYRQAHRREQHERQRAEGAVRRLNARLEQRVAERTAELQMANQQLAGEIVERRKTAKAMRASQAQLADTVDNSTAIVSLKDLDGRYLLVNREFERVLGCRRMVAIGRGDGELFSDELAQRLGARDAEVVRTGAAVSFEQDLTAGQAPGTYVWVKFPLRSTDGSLYGVGSMATDITVLKQLQEELRRHQDELAHVLRMHTMGEMAAALAHEINQPLCAITNYAQGGAQRLRAELVDPAGLLEVFEQIAQEDCVRADPAPASAAWCGAGRSKRPLSTSTPGQRSSADARTAGAVARRDGALRGAADLPLVQANATQIEQVMVNLMLNGVQATSGSERPRREVVVLTAFNGDAVEVAVRDTGEGIAPTVASKLFTPFVTTKERGLGLGLAISRSIIENHGGRLWATPNADAGTTFSFSLPIIVMDDPTATRH